jgi:hypothetical protein
MATGLSSESNDSSNVAEDVFLDELKSQFEKEIDVRKTLDTKANTMITTASAISTLVIAIGTFLISRIADKNFYYTSIEVLAVGIILAVVSVSFFIWSYSVRKYRYPLVSDHFFRNGEYNEKIVEAVRKLSRREFNDKMFQGYLKGIKSSERSNKRKANGIKIGQIFLVLTIIDIAVLVAFILASMGSGQQLNLTK